MGNKNIYQRFLWFDPEKETKMLESFVVDSTALLLLAVIVVNLLLIIKDIIDLYRRTNHVAYRTRRNRDRAQKDAREQEAEVLQQMIRGLKKGSGVYSPCFPFTVSDNRNAAGLRAFDAHLLGKTHLHTDLQLIEFLVHHTVFMKINLKPFLCH